MATPKPEARQRARRMDFNVCYRSRDAPKPLGGPRDKGSEERMPVCDTAAKSAVAAAAATT